MQATVNRVTIEIIQEDIFQLDVMGIVQVTDSNLSVASELSALAGPSVQAACTQIGWCEVGSAVITNGGRLKAKKIIHAVGPQWGEGSERGKLVSTVWKVLTLAEENEVMALALPAISTGALGYPLENCAVTILNQVLDFTFERVKFLKRIVICLDDEIAFQVFQDEFKRQLDELKASGAAKISKVGV
jgi:O-acetyl-ADP-ribose deacetylase (regulator of RNase III)